MKLVIQELYHTRAMFEDDLIRIQHEIMQHYQHMNTLPPDILEADINQFIPLNVQQDLLEKPEMARRLFEQINQEYLRRNDIVEEKEEEMENYDPNSQTPEKVQVQQKNPTPPRPRHLPIDQKQNKKQIITKKFKK
ncbi:hypothetical protein pb186bvf_019182 [Paramecium bursaria]